jgi:O-antigen/teichoic acid export membrane protein
VRGIFGSLGLTITTAGLTFVNGILLARLLGAESYGIYASAIAVVLLLSPPLALGFDRLLLRNIAAASAGGWNLAHGLLLRSVQLVVPATILAVVILGVGGLLAESSLAPGTLPVLWIALPMIPLLALTILRRAITLGIKRIVSSQLPDALIRPGLFAVLLGVAYLTLGTTSATAAMTLNLVSVVAAFVVGIALLRKQAPRDLRGAAPAYATRRWVVEAAPFAFAALAQTLMNQIDVVLVGALAGAAPAGVYAVAARGAALTLFGAAAVNTTLAPTASELFARHEHRRLQVVVTRAARGAFLFALGVAAVLWLFGPQFLLLFGSEFTGASDTLAVLALASVIDCGFGIAGVILSMTGHQGLNFVAIAGAIATRVVLGLILIPAAGAFGAATAALVSIVVLNVLATYFAALRLGIDATPLGFSRSSRAA